MSLLKLIYLAAERIEAKWHHPISEWALTAQQLHIIFGARMPMRL